MSVGDSISQHFVLGHDCHSALLVDAGIYGQVAGLDALNLNFG